MEAYAVIETGGKQYRVQKDDVLSVELLADAKVGQQIELGRVLAFNWQTGLCFDCEQQSKAEAAAKTDNVKGGGNDCAS